MQLRAMAMARCVFACAGPADEDDVALLGDESAAGQIAHESLVDRRILEGEVFDVFG